MKEPSKQSPHDKLQRELDALSTLLESFLSSHRLSFEELLHLLKEKHEKKTPLMVPSAILRDGKLGIMEAVVKYLKEEFHLSYHDIAVLLKRDDRVVWTTYNNALRKRKEKLSVSGENVWLPLSVFADPQRGPLEAVAIYLKDSAAMSFKEIGQLLNRDNRVIWSVYHRRKRHAT
jgi:hypothetical protein